MKRIKKQTNIVQHTLLHMEKSNIE